MSSTTGSAGVIERTPKGAARRALSLTLLAAATLLTIGCSGSTATFAYTGRADVDAITLSAQVAGVIDSLAVEEGSKVKKGEVLAVINTDRLQVQRKQQMAQLAELDVQRSGARSQIRQAEARLKLARDTLAKTERVLAAGGATPQRRDELSTQVEVDQADLASLQSNYKLIAAKEEELRAAMELTEISIRDAKIVSPIDGVVLDTFHYAGELAGVGTPLIEVADLSVMTVEIYLPLSELSSISIGTPATVFVNGKATTLRGKVSWISSEAEFTPKTILTRETRTTLVYAVKIRVENRDGVLKIGMPVDVRL